MTQPPQSCSKAHPAPPAQQAHHTPHLWGACSHPIKAPRYICGRPSAGSGGLPLGGTHGCVLSPDLVFSITCSPVSSKRPKLPPCTQLCLKKPWEVTQPSPLGPAPGDTQGHRGCSAHLKPTGSSGGGPGSPPAVGLPRSPDCICECPLALQGRREDGRAGRWSMWRTGLEAASTFGAFPSPGLVQGSGWGEGPGL